MIQVNLTNVLLAAILIVLIVVAASDSITF